MESIVEQISPANEKVHIFDCSDSFASGIGRFREVKSIPGVSFTVYAKADEINKENVDFLRRIGVTKISIGVETGSSELMRKIGKHPDSVAKNLKAAKMLKDNGISIYANLIYGVPGETPEQTETTVNQLEKKVQNLGIK